MELISLSLSGLPFLAVEFCLSGVGLFMVSLAPEVLTLLSELFLLMRVGMPVEHVPESLVFRRLLLILVFLRARRSGLRNGINNLIDSI